MWQSQRFRISLAYLSRRLVNRLAVECSIKRVIAHQAANAFLLAQYILPHARASFNLSLKTFMFLGGLFELINPGLAGVPAERDHDMKQINKASERKEV